MPVHLIINNDSCNTELYIDIKHVDGHVIETAAKHEELSGK